MHPKKTPFKIKTMAPIYPQENRAFKRKYARNAEAGHISVLIIVERLGLIYVIPIFRA